MAAKRKGQRRAGEMGALAVLAGGLGEDERLERDGCICGAAWPGLLPASSLQSLNAASNITENGAPGKKIAAIKIKIRRGDSTHELDPLDLDIDAVMR